MQRMKKHKPAAREPSWDPSPMQPLGRSLFLPCPLSWGQNCVGRGWRMWGRIRPQEMGADGLQSPLPGSAAPRKGPLTSRGVLGHP